MKGTTRQILYKRDLNVKETVKKDPVKKKEVPTRDRKAAVSEPEPLAAGQNDLSARVYAFLKSHPLIALKRLSDESGIDNANFNKKMAEGRPIPEKPLRAMVAILKKYGFGG